jgi:intein-encoded DNA endonuclease-like protein
MTFNRISLSKLTGMETGYLIGLFAGDGYSYYDKKYRHYTVEFHLHSERNKGIQKFLIKILKKLGLRVFVMKDKRYNCNRVRVYSKILLKYLNLGLLDKDDINMGLGFVSGLIDSEGYVNHKKSFVNVVNTDKETLNMAKNILKKLNIVSEIRERGKSKKDKKKSYILYISYKIKDIDTNSIKSIAGKMLSGDYLPLVDNRNRAARSARCNLIPLTHC